MGLNGLLADAGSAARMAEQTERTGGDYAPPWVWALAAQELYPATGHPNLAIEVYISRQGLEGRE